MFHTLSFGNAWQEVPGKYGPARVGGGAEVVAVVEVVAGALMPVVVVTGAEVVVGTADVDVEDGSAARFFGFRRAVDRVVCGAGSLEVDDVGFVASAARNGAEGFVHPVITISTASTATNGTGHMRRSTRFINSQDRPVMLSRPATAHQQKSGHIDRAPKPDRCSPR